MIDVPQPLGPEMYGNPHVAGAVTVQFIWAGVRHLLALIGRNREVRRLSRIGILPPDWDAAGRHCEHR